jgi:hypothetical protein
MPVIIDGTNGITQAGEFNSDSSFGFKNRIINGAMVIAQRGTSAVTTDDSYPVDRFYVVGNTTTWSAVQSSTAPAGFNYSTAFTNGTGASPSAAQRTFIAQAIEGFNTADLGWGTADAKTVTVSFWVRSSLTGAFGGSVRNNAGNRSYPFSYTISAANTWEQKSVTITGDTTGTWEKTTTRGILLIFNLGSGSDYQGTANTWAAANQYFPAGATNLVATTGATFFLTGVQLEVGSTATSFDYRPYGTELALCQRYYWQMVNGDQNNICSGTYYANTTFVGSIQFPVTMRSAPTLAYATGTSYYVIYTNNTSDTINSMYLGATSTITTNIETTDGVSGTAGYGGQMRSNNASAKLAFTAEL